MTEQFATADYPISEEFYKELKRMIVSRHILYLQKMRDESAAGETMTNDDVIQAIAENAVELDFARCSIDDDTVRFYYKTVEPPKDVVLKRAMELYKKKQITNAAKNIFNEIDKDVEVARAVMEADEASKH